MGAMRAIVLDPERQGPETIDGLPAASFLQVDEVPTPDLPGHDWCVIRSGITGICGSDLGILQGKEMPAFEPYASSAFIMGHELSGTVEAVGPAVGGLHTGDRVVVDPTLACAERGFEPGCHACARGDTACERWAEGRLEPGALIGLCASTGGGWGEYFVARAERVHRVPDAVSDETASLVEPLAVSMRPALQHCPAAGDEVVVIGAGSIGLFTIAALRAAQPACRITAIAKYGFQAEMAGALGADRVIDLGEEDAVEAIGAHLGTRVFTLSTGAKLLAGGVPFVFDTVTNAASLNQGLAILRGSGRLVLLGLPSVPVGVDWTPMVMKEARVVGSVIYGREHFEGRAAPTFARALEWLETGRAEVEAIRPRTFPIERYAEALATANDKAGSGAVKISFAL